MNEQLRKALDVLDGVRECGEGRKARCPVHDDRKASLTIAEGDDVPFVATCHKGCPQEDVLRAIRQRINGFIPSSCSGDSEVETSDPPEKKNATPKKEMPEWDPWEDGEVINEYVYTDVSGDALFKVVRIEPEPGHPAHGLDKEFRQLRCAPGHPKARHDGYVWGRGDITPPLYRLPVVKRAADEGHVLFVVEGEKDADTLCEVGLRATTCLQGAGEWKKRYADDLAGAHVVVLPDNDRAGRNHAKQIAASCHDKAASVRVVELPDLPPKGDVSDWLDAGHDVEDLQEEVTETSAYEPPETRKNAAPPDRTDRAKPDAEGRKAANSSTPSQAQILLALANDVELFNTPKGDAFTTFAIGKVHYTTRIENALFGDYLRHQFRQKEGKPPSAQSLRDAKNALRAEAFFDGESREVHLRIAGHEGQIYVDLCNDDREVVKITAEGWEIVNAGDVPVKFRRVRQMKRLPKPKRGGSLSQFRKHIRLSDEDFLLLLGFLVQCLRPTGPYPVLEISGEHGSGKTFFMRLLRGLIDPSDMPIRARPNSERDLVIAAENAWILSFDNMSGVKPRLSDALCRLSTGGGFGTRKLYTNREEEVFYALRPVILNGINKLAGRSDLADRAIRLELKPIPDEEREPQALLWKNFRQDRPHILGALFDAVSTALRRMDDVTLDRPPRMADFARWAVAAEPAFPTFGVGEGGAFLHAYKQNRAVASKTAVEADTVASAIRAMLDDVGEWTGTVTELMNDLQEYVPKPQDPPQDFPDTHQAMTPRLKRIMPDLRAIGIERESHKRTSDERTFTLRNVGDDETDGGHTDGSKASEEQIHSPGNRVKRVTAS